MRSDPTLKKYFNEFNKKYFDNSLPKRTAVMWGEVDSGHEGECDFSGVITLDEKIRETGLWAHFQMVLYHEMVHLKLWKSHPDHECGGEEFHKEMLRLAGLGAFNDIW